MQNVFPIAPSPTCVHTELLKILITLHYKYSGRVKAGLSVEDLRGVGYQTRDKLKAAGITSLEALAVLSARELSTMTGIDEKKALELVDQARRLLGLAIQTASQILERRKNILRITTGSKALDGILGGGIETQAVTEFCGAFGSGKSQLCHQLCVNLQLPAEEGGTRRQDQPPPAALFIDTESTFRPERLAQMAEAKGLNPKDVLGHTYVAEALSSDHLALIVDKCFSLIPENHVKLVLVDSIIGKFRPEYIGRESLAERQQKLNRVLAHLLKQAEAYNTAVVITNQIISTPGIPYGNPDKPAGGNVLAHISTYRLWLVRHSGGRRTIRLFDSPCHPEGEASFQITARGIEDMSKKEGA
ncbi:MAG: DNA repair and recombination protein RadA [Candidatus Hecatellaceae archaeon]